MQQCSSTLVITTVQESRLHWRSLLLLQDFLEGCRDAYFMVNSLVSEQSWAVLSQMVSPRLVSAFR